YLPKKLAQFRAENPPIIWRDPQNETQVNYFYYGDTSLLDQVRYYPLVQLLIIGLFIILTIVALTTSFRSAQNQVWAGMAKETAHQLGTPLSSLQGWVEMLKGTAADARIVEEMSKDVDRLRLVSDRFGKIGSTPHLEPHDILQQVSTMMEYMRKRATDKVVFQFNTQHQQLVIPVSPPLFDWVIENLLKNALDAMEARGTISVTVHADEKEVYIDISDTGKGISPSHVRKVFTPGFTTKKRGWGLGLSLSKRIIEQYHRGKLFVKQTEVGKGTTFRIILHK
ncbi:MAG: sensor histidine kinase, partial [Chitinophagaceae bacterium]